MSPKVKICGITQLSDAIAAVESGAGALGFVFYPQSPRCLGLKAAAEIIRELPPFIAKVGVFVNAREDSIQRTISECGLDTLQFHGDESPDFCRRFCVKVIKAFRIQGADSLSEMAPYSQEGWLLDSFVPGIRGGTGAIFNWDLAREAAKLNRHIILAGGLTPSNIAEAVERVRPYGVDVSSGVELEPGKKDPQKVREFIANAKRR